MSSPKFKAPTTPKAESSLTNTRQESASADRKRSTTDIRAAYVDTANGHDRLGATTDLKPADTRYPSATKALGATIVGLLATYWVVLEPRFYYGNDDLLQFSYADQYGLSLTTLTENVFQHIAPVNRLAHLIVLRIGDVAPLAGFLFSFAAYVLFLLSVLWLSTELRLSTPRRVGVLIAVGLSISVYQTGIWFDAAMHIFPALTLTLGVLAAHARALRTGERRWHTISIAIFLLGPLTQERPLFALPLLVLMDVFLIWSGESWSRRLSRLWGMRGPLAVMTGIGFVVAVGYKLFVVVPDVPSPQWSTTLITILVSFTWFVLPSLVNAHPDITFYGHGAGPPGGWVAQVAVLLLVAGVFVLLRRISRRNVGPLLFCLGAFFIYYGFLKFSPLLNDFTLYFNASRLHNVAYVTVPAVIGLASLEIPALSRSLRTKAPRNRTSITVSMIVVLVVAMLAGNLYHQGTENDSAVESRGYIDAVRAAEPAWSDPAVNLIPLYAPESIANGWAVPFGRHDRFLSLFAPGWQPAEGTAAPVVITDHGAVVPVTLNVMGEAAGISEQRPSCAHGGRQPVLGLRLDHRVSADIVFAAITYEAAVISGGQLTAVDSEQVVPNAFPVAFQPGRHTAIFPIDAHALRTMSFQNLNPLSDLCVSHLSIVAPVLPPDSSGVCYYVDRYGAPGDRTPCHSPSTAYSGP